MTDNASRIRREYVEGYESHPGRFEGEGPETVYFYDLTMDGSGDELSCMEDGCGEYACMLEVDDDEREAFEFPSNVTHFLVTQSEYGFISGTPLTTREADKVRKQYEALDALHVNEA